MVDEKIHTINLRREFIKAPTYKKTKKAVTAIKEYISKHMKVSIDNVKIGKNLNLKLWKNGRKNPPAKLKVKSIVKESNAYVELPEFAFEEPKPVETKEAKKAADKLKEKLEAKAESSKEAKKENLKTLEKEELKLEKKEHMHEHALQPDKHTKDTQAKGEAKSERKTVPRTGKKESHEGKP